MLLDLMCINQEYLVEIVLFLLVVTAVNVDGN